LKELLLEHILKFIFLLFFFLFIINVFFAVVFVLHSLFDLLEALLYLNFLHLPLELFLILLASDFAQRVFASFLCFLQLLLVDVFFLSCYVAFSDGFLPCQFKSALFLVLNCFFNGLVMVVPDY